MELEDYFEEIGEQKIEEIWYLQRYAEGNCFKYQNVKIIVS